jgi:hypothetical protein
MRLPYISQSKQLHLSFILSISALATSIMRLLNTTTIKLHEFFGTDIPYYAILSHRWGIDEVTFQDMQHGRGPEMAGWAKIAGCCAQALKEGWEYAVRFMLSMSSKSGNFSTLLTVW